MSYKQKIKTIYQTTNPVSRLWRYNMYYVPCSSCCVILTCLVEYQVFKHTPLIYEWPKPGCQVIVIYLHTCVCWSLPFFMILIVMKFQSMKTLVADICLLHRMNQDLDECYNGSSYSSSTSYKKTYSNFFEFAFVISLILLHNAETWFNSITSYFLTLTQR